MAFTDHSDLFAAVHEDGINLVGEHIKMKRPSLFNYATQFIADNPHLACHRIKADPVVLERNNPLFSVESPLPVLGTDGLVALNYCIQLVEGKIDFHPDNAIKLPPELDPLPGQSFSLAVKICVGLDCPSDDLVDYLEDKLGEMHRPIEVNDYIPTGKDRDKATSAKALKSQVMAARRLSRDSGVMALAGKSDCNCQKKTTATTYKKVPQQTAVLKGYSAASRESAALYYQHERVGYVEQKAPNIKGTKGKEGVVIPSKKLQCFCLEAYAVGHIDVTGEAGRQLITPKLDGFEIVDIRPENMENSMECYVELMVRMGVLPRVRVALEKVVLEQLKNPVIHLFATEGLPNNPAIEDDQLKVFVNMEVVTS